ncbi:PREDICTED: leucine-rich repeat extensin-like protein 5 [Amphimedon queenslandica]|uniref:UBA domain-containing protein n=1 Tax=Amphimedon queenslandica TaxID=400682 RepID=A0A1X7UPS2_AMPQE|nr:PREDICTED: leucine-rich repeat extensin-like protein 5 [Amphimedon queenslandica]|eukprot:XP_003387213.1 PREDICTED: leucine-rich repeat extensin-like protein 5 [Amphimedon queenslandica]
MADTSPLVRRPTISRQSGPTYINSYALKGIRVSYRTPIPIPEAVSLPRDWSMPQLNEPQHIADLTKERQVIEQANLRRQAIAGEATSPYASLRGGTICPPQMPPTSTIPLIPYQNSTILTPVPAPSDSTAQLDPPVANVSTSTAIDKPLGEMSLRDFEGESDPFEVTALQAIDVYSELQSVLQPQTSTTTVPPTSNTGSSGAPTSLAPPGQPPGYTSQSPSSQSSYITTTSPLPPPVSGPLPPPVSGPAPPPVSGATDNLYITTASPIPRPLSGPLPPPPSGSSEGLYEAIGPAENLYEAVSPRRNEFGIMFDVGGGQDRQQEQIPSSIQYPPPPSSSPSPLPPPVAPKPTARSSPRIVPSPNPSHRPFAGVSVLPPVGQLPQQPAPPPYSSEPSSYSSYHPSPPPPPKVYSLPDIRSSLTPAEKESLESISSMGFPPTRVARALKKYENDNQKVFDFLFLVGEIVDKGYNGDSAETALIAHKEDVEKSLDYLQKVDQYKEVWPEGKIHEAYNEAGGSWEDTIDILTQGS